MTTLNTLTAINFCQHKNRDFEYLPGVTGVTGSNAAGKTNIGVAAPLFALTAKAIGTYPATRKKDELLHDQDGVKADKGKVMWSFDTDGVLYDLSRNLQDSGCCLKWEADGVKQELKKDGQIKEKLEQIWGIPSELIEELCFVRQGKLCDCLQMTRSEFMPYMQKILNLQRAEKIRSLLQAKLSSLPPVSDRSQLIVDARKAIEVMETQLTAAIAKTITAKGQLVPDEMLVEAKTDLSKPLDTTIQQKITDTKLLIAAQESVVYAAETELNNLLADIEGIKQQIGVDVPAPLQADITASLKIIEGKALPVKAKAAADDLQTQEASLIPEPVMPSTEDLDNIKAALAAINPKLELAKTSVCPTCKRPFTLDFDPHEVISDHQELTAMLEGAQRTWIAARDIYNANLSKRSKQTMALGQARANVKRLNADLDTYNMLVQEYPAERIEKIQEDQQVYSNQQKLKASERICSQKIVDARSKVAILAEKLPKLRTDVAVAENDLKSCVTAETRREAQLIVEAEITMRKDYISFQEEETKLGAQLEISKHNLAAVESQAEKDVKILKLTNLLTRARDVLHMDRLPAIPMRRARSKLNKAIALWLARFGGTVTAQLDENFEWFRTDTRVQAYSGAEAVKVALAFHLAKVDLLAGKLPLLILDEPTHNLDKEAQMRFCDIVRQLQVMAGQRLYITIVTHDEALLGSMSRVVKIEKQ